MMIRNGQNQTALAMLGSWTLGDLPAVEVCNEGKFSHLLRLARFRFLLSSIIGLIALDSKCTCNGRTSNFNEMKT